MSAVQTNCKIGSDTVNTASIHCRPSQHPTQFPVSPGGPAAPHNPPDLYQDYTLTNSLEPGLPVYSAQNSSEIDSQLQCSEDVGYVMLVKFPS